MVFSIKAGGFCRSDSARAGQLLDFYLKRENVNIEDQLRQVSEPAEPADSPLTEEKCLAALLLCSLFRVLVRKLFPKFVGRRGAFP